MRLRVWLGVAVVTALALVACSGRDSSSGSAETQPAASPTKATATTTPVTPTADSTLESVSATPLPAGLSTAVVSQRPVTVWVYARSAAAANCDDLLASMLPAELYGSSTPREKATCQPGNARYRFLQDSEGTFYVDIVEILPIGLPSLPDSFDYSCESIVSHLVPATADPTSAKYVLVCGDHIPPRGSNPNTVRVWVRLVKSLAPAVLPAPSTPCWETSRYLGGATEAETVEVVCTLDE
ncbi:MAG: hypothetical protein ABI577_01780 [bacterium]